MVHPSRHQVQLAAYCLARGGVIAYPTEAVWGLGCDPGNEQAVTRLLALKGRDIQKGLILVAASMAQLQPWLAKLTLEQRQRLQNTWPGPVTWVVPDDGIAPVWVRGRHHSVALRVSAHPVVAALCTAFGGPIVSTSANPSARPPARRRLQVRRYFQVGVDRIVPGALGGLSRPTEIRHLLDNHVLRRG